MGTGYLNQADLELVLGKAFLVPGDIVEVGVLHGALTRRLVAARGDRVVHACDSFHGMGEPGPKDNDQYPKGRMSVGGLARFTAIMAAVGCPEGSYVPHAGYVPDCLPIGAAPFCFVYIDVDHYEPTRVALEWAWPQIAVGGVLGLDDYFPGRGFLAGGAINEWLKRENPRILHKPQNDQIFLEKT